jgi:hypothetical protein
VERSLDYEYLYITNTTQDDVKRPNMTTFDPCQ